MTNNMGRVVSVSLGAGVVVAPAIVTVGPVAGAQEHVVTGTILLAFACSWALLAMLSRRIGQPQSWAAMPAVFFGGAGAALLVLAPGGSTLDTLGWVWPPALLVLIAATVTRAHRDLQSRSRSVVVYPLLGAYALCAIGGGYQTIRESRDRQIHGAPGQLIDVGDHRLHLHCVGSGTPTVLLESALGETGAYWRWIQPDVAAETRVCTYDRAGRGWSDAAASAQDGVGVAADLHTLLDRGHIPGPFVLVGHSSGAQYVRIFAGRYPDQVAGMVLLDGQPADAFEGLPAYPAFYNSFRRIDALLPSLARVGIGRLLALDDEHSSARHYRSLRDEFVELPASLAQAASQNSIGNRPLVVVTASVDPQAGWFTLQDKLATLSTNCSHRIVPFTHAALVDEQVAARASSGAILDVVHAVRFGSHL